MPASDVRSRQALSFYFYLIAFDSSNANVGSQSNVPLEVVADLTPVRTDPGAKNAYFATLWGDRNGTLWPVYSYQRSDALLLCTDQEEIDENSCVLQENRDYGFA
jgi:hypothetical protein